MLLAKERGGKKQVVNGKAALSSFVAFVMASILEES